MERREYMLGWSGLNFQVTEWGSPDGLPILMLHGLRGYGETFSGVARVLQPKYRVIALDQRGRGGSDWDPARHYWTSTYVADVEHLVDALGLRRFDLLGHSMGGASAIVYAARHGDRIGRLIIEDAGPGAFETSPGSRRIRAELETTPPRFENWEAASEFMRGLRPTVTEEARQQRLRSMLKATGDGGYTWRHDQAGIAWARFHPDPAGREDLAIHVRALTPETLLIRGERSDYMQADMAQRMLDMNPRIREAVIADAGHYVHDDQPQAFEQVVADFLRD